MDTHQVGDTVRLEATFTNLAEVPTDPTTVTLKVEEPDGTETFYTLAGAGVTKSAAGIFYKDLVVDAAGTWSFQWVGTGAVAQSIDGQFFIQPSTFDVEQTGWNELRERVYQVVRDSARTHVSEDEVDLWLGEAIGDLSRRLPILQKQVTGTTNGTINLPPDYVDTVTLKVAGTFVTWVDDDIFEHYEGSSQTLGRIFNGVVELTPSLSGAPYTLRYFSSSSTLDGLSPSVRSRIVNFARAHALYKYGEFQAGDRYMQMYEDGLPRPSLVPHKPGPVTLQPVGNWFDSAEYLS